MRGVTILKTSARGSRLLVATVLLAATGVVAVGPAPAGAVVAQKPPPAASPRAATSTTVPVGAGSSSTAASTSTTVPIEPKAYVVLDADTGAVVVAKNDRVPMPPASLTKVLTALAAGALLDPAGKIAISPRAAAEPANKVGALAGQQWPTDVAMNVMLLESANDLAMAVAEQAGGSAEGFQDVLGRASTRLGMADGPVFRDPAGLDDSQSVDGGNLVSARDLAIASRALVTDPWLGPIVAGTKYGFTDPAGVVHEAVNHNKLVLQGSGGYPGAIGVKTGFTKRAGRCLIGAAKRDGRTMIAVVLNVPEMYLWVHNLLDQGFATPVAAEAAYPRVGPVVRLTPADLLPHGQPQPPSSPASSMAPRYGPGAGSSAHLAASTVSLRRDPLTSQLLPPLVLGGGAVLLLSAAISRLRRRQDDYRLKRKRR